jgi:integrase
MAKKLTILGVERLSAKGNAYTRVVDGNLYIKVHPTGRKVWMYRYVESGTKSRKWLSLGEVSAINTMEVAKAKSDDYNRNLEEVGDPQKTTEGDQTFAELFSLFMSRGVDRQGKPLSERTLSFYEYSISTNVLPYLGNHKVKDLRKRDILPVLEKIVDRGARSLANLTYRRMKRIFNFAAARDIIEFNPMANMELVGEIKNCDRVLSDSEIKTFLEWETKSKEAWHVMRLILITGARPGEVTGLCKAEIEGDWWVIPPERTKAGAENRIFLTDMAKELLPEDSFTISRPAVGEYLRRAVNAGKELKEKGKVKGSIFLSVPPFTPHDLRRTMATNLAELGFTDEIINACQGRAKRGVIATYNRYRYDKERQLTAEAWSRKLASIMSEEAIDNVIPLRK